MRPRPSLSRISLLLALASMPALASCSEDIAVRVERTSTGTTFHFGMSGVFSSKFKPVCLRMVEVRRAETDEVIWKSVKQADKCTLINSVDLGSSIPDFVEQINRLPLQEDQNYVVSIIADEGSVTSDAWR